MSSVRWLDGRTGDVLARARRAGGPCVVEGVAWPALAATGWVRDWPAAEASLGRFRVALRPRARVARSGGAFAPGCSDAMPTVATYAARARTRSEGLPLAFSTSRADELVGALARVLDAPPAGLRSAAAYPIVSLGPAGEATERPHGGVAPCVPLVTASGLAFHRHDESWLWLVCGSKRWAFADPARAAHAALLGADADGPLPAGASVLRAEQRAGELVYVPAGWWHATRDAPAADGSPVAFGLGGLGRSPGLHFAAARGDAPAVRAAGGTRVRAAAAEGLSRSLAHTAALHAQPAVLRTLLALDDAERAAGEPPLALAVDGELGALALHWACGGTGDEAVESVGLLLDASGARASHARDRTGATPLHWVARGGDVGVAAALLAAGADAAAADARGVRPLHLAAAEGHGALARWLVRDAAVDPRARDADGRTARDWAEACGCADESVLGALGVG